MNKVGDYVFALYEESLWKVLFFFYFLFLLQKDNYALIHKKMFSNKIIVGVLMISVILKNDNCILTWEDEFIMCILIFSNVNSQVHVIDSMSNKNGIITNNHWSP
jgi:hypothetical protein